MLPLLTRHPVDWESFFSILLERLAHSHVSVCILPDNWCKPISALRPPLHRTLTGSTDRFNVIYLSGELTLLLFMFHKVLQVGRYRLRVHRTETCSDRRVDSTEQEALRLFHETASLEEISNRICDSREIEMNTRLA